jgi:hypothetical protein
MKRLLLPGWDSMIFLIVAISCVETDRLRYVMIGSIHEAISHLYLERKLFLKKNAGAVQAQARNGSYP